MMELLFAGLACAASLGIGWYFGRAHQRDVTVPHMERHRRMIGILESSHDAQQCELDHLRFELAYLRETVGKLIDQRHCGVAKPRPLGAERTDYELYR